MVIGWLGCEKLIVVICERVVLGKVYIGHKDCVMLMFIIG
jgi:hypothetical protein